jgi:uncharacterized protein (TIGR03663 family)
MNKAAFRGLFFIIVVGALLFRLLGLDLRPMHHDEANQAVKFGLLLEKGEYRYDLSDHHGPSLYYLTLPLAWAFSKTTLASLDEVILRLLPALFGAGVLLLLLLFVKGMGRTAVFFAGLFAALSPAMVYYSRFYIQEMLFVFFVIGFLGSLWRYLLYPWRAWALSAGLCAGMMYATKETSVIIFTAAGLALILTMVFQKIKPQTPYHFIAPGFANFFLGLIIAILAAAAFFTSFLKNWQGIWDSLAAFKTYFEKSGGAGFHIQPWPYYFKLLVYSKSGGGPLWSEALILALALVGIVSAFVPRRQKQTVPSPARFIFLYTLFSAAVFFIIPYKTPWNLLPFYAGFIILAGIGAAFLLGLFAKIPVKALVLLVLAAGIYHLGLESYRANFVFYADPANPYVYAQTGTDFLKLVKRVTDVAAIHPDDKKMLIKVICGPYETWPLPWYLRGFERVGYWQTAGQAGPLLDAPVIISDQDQAGKLQPLLGDKFQSEYFGLRPGVVLVLHIREDLWQEYLKRSLHGSIYYLDVIL